MQPSALRALEFDRIVEAVGDFALTPMGAERLDRLQPSTDARTVAQLLAATTETTRYIDAHGVFPLRATGDLPQILTALAVEGRALEALRLIRSTSRGPASAARRDRTRCSRPRAAAQRLSGTRRRMRARRSTRPAR